MSHRHILLCPWLILCEYTARYPVRRVAFGQMKWEGLKVNHDDLMATLPKMTTRCDSAVLEKLLELCREAGGESWAVMSFAHRLGCLAEAEMTEVDEGRAKLNLEDVIESCIQDADISGIANDPFVIEHVIRTLCAIWVHGDSMRRWHNSRHGMPNYKGIVCSALRAN